VAGRGARGDGVTAGTRGDGVTAGTRGDGVTAGTRGDGMTGPPDATALLHAGADRHRVGDLAGAAALYAQALRLDPAQADAHNLLGVLARQRGAPVEALAYVDRALALAPGNAAYLANRGAALAEAGRLSDAVPALRAALAARPEDPVTQRNLGQALAATGDPVAAQAPLREATRLTPDAPEPWLGLAHALRDAGDDAAAREAAAAAFARAGGNPLLAEQAQFLLAGLGGAAPPLRAPAGYVRALFDLFAPRFDSELAALGYATPTLLAALLEEVGVAADQSRRVLDLGCGTGLSGLALAPFAARLDGVDLSPRMVEAAAARGLYAALHEADLLDFLPANPGAFDLIVAADVLNYLGDLVPVCAAMAGGLAAGGYVAFSVETTMAAPVILASTLRFRHEIGYVIACCEAAGLHLRAERDATLRREQGEPVAGALFVFQRS